MKTTIAFTTFSHFAPADCDASSITINGKDAGRILRSEGVDGVTRYGFDAPDGGWIVPVHADDDAEAIAIVRDHLIDNL